MATYIKPQVLVYQEFQATPSAADTDLRAWIVGPNGVTHKRGEESIGDYADVPRGGLTTEIPGLEAGSLVDEPSVKVCVDNALLQYAHVKVDTTSSTRAYNNPGTPNELVFDGFNLAEFKTYQRASALGNRDVQPGDTVRISGYAASIPGVTQCEDVSFDTKVLALSVEETASSIGPVVRQTNKGGSYETSVQVQVGDGDPTAASDATVGGTYAGLMAEEVYTLTIVNDGEKAYYIVDSASGIDSFPTMQALPEGVAVEASGSVEAHTDYTFAVGKKGLTLTVTELPEVSTDTTSYIITLTYEGITEGAVKRFDPDHKATELTGDALTADGKNFTFTGHYDPKPTGWIRQKYWITATAVNTTTSCQNVEFHIVSESGLDDSPKVQATVSGSSWSFKLNNEITGSFTQSQFESIEPGDTWLYEFSGAYDPISIETEGTYTGDDDDTYIITCVSGGQVGSEDNIPKVVIHSRTGSEYIGPVEVTEHGVLMSLGVQFNFVYTEASGNDPASNDDMALNDTWVCRVRSSKSGRVNGLVLRDSIPDELRSVSASSIVPLDVKFCVSEDIEISDFELEDTTISIPFGVKVEVEGITERNGAPKPLDLIAGEMSVQYREWSANGAGCLNYIANTDELDRIPGAIEPDNPLKYGVYKALANSNGTTVVYTPVVGNSLDAWNDAFAAGIGSREVYTLVPLSQDIQILNLAATVINNDSNEETCAWKNGFFNVAAPTRIMRVGKSDNLIHQTSTDGEKVFATIIADETGKGVVEITSKDAGRANASLLEVKEGDELRVFGTGRDYTSYIITGIKGDTLTIRGVNESVVIPTSIEVWHHLKRDEQVDYICDIAQSFSNRRIKLVWPDLVGEGGWELPGTILCAALAGMISGILPNQSMTRVSLSGFDDLTRSLGYFTDTQIKKLAASGVWCVIEDQDGTVYTMHGLTTDTLSIQFSEEMMTRIIDLISFRIRDLLDTYIGTTNVTEDTMSAIHKTLSTYLGRVAASNYNAVGPLITKFAITSIEQDPLLLDRINVVVNLVVVKCTNYIAVHVQAS